jgi:hypothetical protein
MYGFLDGFWSKVFYCILGFSHVFLLRGSPPFIEARPHKKYLQATSLDNDVSLGSLSRAFSIHPPPSLPVRKSLLDRVSMPIAPFHTFVVVSGGFWASFSRLHRLRGDDGFIGKVEVSNEKNSGDGSIKCLAQISCARRYLFWKVACTRGRGSRKLE